MADYTQGITIDGVEFLIPLLSIKRTADALDKYAERTEDGDLKREVIGVYYNYQLSVGTVDDDATYMRLYDKLTEPIAFHDFTLPTTGGTYSFRGYISSVSDEIEKVYTDTVKFKGLTCKFTAKAPARRPGG